MRIPLLTSAAVLGLALTAPAFAATNGTEYIPPPHQLMREGVMNPATGARYGHVPGVGISLPTSRHASNITPSDTYSQIAPTLPKPPVNANAGMDPFLHAARNAVAAGKTGMAQESLERAMTARLNEDVLRSVYPRNDPVIRQIQAALDDLSHHRYAAVDRRIAQAMTGTGVAENEPYGGGSAGMGMGVGGPGMTNTYGSAYGETPTMANTPQTSARGGLPPTGAPSKTANVGTLGTQVVPPGMPMNPTGNPKY